MVFPIERLRAFLPLLIASCCIAGAAGTAMLDMNAMDSSSGIAGPLVMHVDGVRLVKGSDIQESVSDKKDRGYKISVGNAGDETAHDVLVIFPTGPGTVKVNNPRCIADVNTATAVCTLGDIGGGESKSVAIVLHYENLCDKSRNGTDMGRDAPSLRMREDNIPFRVNLPSRVTIIPDGCAVPANEPTVVHVSPKTEEQRASTPAVIPVKPLPPAPAERSSVASKPAVPAMPWLKKPAVPAPGTRTLPITMPWLQKH